MAYIPFLYGELNKQVEYLKYTFTSTDGSTVIKQNQENNSVDISVNTTQLVTLKQIQKDLSMLDDPIKYYSLYAYNPNTRAYDIRLGDEIVVDTSASGGTSSVIKEAWIQVGEKQMVDANGNPLFTEDEYGNKIPLMEPIYQKIETVVNTETGQLQLSGIPVSALVDTHMDGSIIESVLDGNSKGVY